MPDPIASPIASIALAQADSTNRLFVTKLLREHLQAGTLPPHWGITRMRETCVRHGIEFHGIGSANAQIAAQPTSAQVAN